MKAKKGAWRIPENTLLLCAFFFGAIGAYIGMKNFRHKTKHTRFRVLVPLFVVLNLAFIAALQAAPQRIEEVLLKITSAF